MAPLSWTRRNEGPWVIFALQGSITESAALDRLASELGQQNVMDTSNIELINSGGVREWMLFVRQSEKEGKDLEFLNCSTPFVNQLNMIAGFGGGKRVRSVHAPYVCPDCDRCETRLIDVHGDIAAQLAVEMPCPSCAVSMEFDDFPEHYFAFLRPR